MSGVGLGSSEFSQFPGIFSATESSFLFAKFGCSVSVAGLLIFFELRGFSFLCRRCSL